MSRKLNFTDLAINSTALLCPNPIEWFTKSYLGNNVAGNFKLIPGVKSSAKVSTAVMPNLLKAEDCDFTAAASVLSAVTMSVCPVQAQTQICKRDLETSYVSLEMSKGSSNWSVAAFMSHFWEVMSMEIAEEIEYIRWVGDTANTAYTGNFKKLCDGYEAQLLANGQVIDVALTAVTVSNVINNFGKVLMALPAAVKWKRSDLRFYCASDVVTAYQIATSSYNTLNNVTQLLDLTFGGIKIVECPGMSNGKMVLTAYTNLVYLFDGEGDDTDLKAINLQDTTAQPLLRTAAWLKIGFGLLNPEQIVYFN